MPLFTALTLKNGHILEGVYLICLKKCARPNLKAFNITFRHY